MAKRPKNNRDNVAPRPVAALSPAPAPVRSAPVRRPAAQPVRRPDRGGTFHVARALDRLAATLPNIVKPRPSARPLTLDRSQPPVVASAARPRPAPLDSPRQRLNLDRLDAPTCKKRPTSNKGSGGSRAFVPWCKKS